MNIEKINMHIKSILITNLTSFGFKTIKVLIEFNNE